MWDNNQGGGNFSNQDVNTNITTFFGSMSYLQLGCWNDKLSFTWVPAKGVAEGTGRVQYDKDVKVKTALTHDKVEAMLAKYKEQIEAKVKACEDPGPDGLFAGVPVSSKVGEERVTNAVGIEYRRDENGKPAAYFTLAKNVDAMPSNNAIRYKFNTTETIVGTSPEVGKLERGQIEGELMWFVVLLEAHNDLNRYGDHQHKLTDQYKNRVGGGQQQNSGYQQGNPQSYGDMSFMNNPNDTLGDMSDFSAFS